MQNTMDCAETPNSPEPLPSIAPSPVPCVRRRIGRALAILMLAGLVAYGSIHWYLNHQANWGVVEPAKIFRSATVSRFLIRQKLQDNKIAVIVFLSRDDGHDPDLAAERQAAQDLHIDIQNFPMRGDGVATPSQYPQALAAIYRARQAGKPVLIHCHSGSERTGGVVAIYRLLIERKTPAEAYAEMVHYGFRPNRNKTLLPFLNEFIEDWAKALAAQEIIPAVPSPLPKLTP